MERIARNRLIFLMCVALLGPPAYAQQPELVIQAGHSGDIKCIAFRPDGRVMASSGKDATIKLWDLASGRELRTLIGHAAAVDAVQFRPDGRTLVSVSQDRTVKVWDLASGSVLQNTLLPFESGSGLFSADGLTLAYIPRDEQGRFHPTVRLWDVAAGRSLGTLSNPDGFDSAALSRDGRMLASSVNAGTIKLWDVRDGRSSKTLAGHNTAIRAFAFSPDGSILASSGGEENEVKFWNLKSGRNLQTIPGRPGPAYGADSLAFSPDGRILAAGYGEGTVKLWHVASGRELRSWEANESSVEAIVFSPDGSTLATGSYDSGIKLWQAGGGRLLRSFAGHEFGIESMGFSENARLLATSNGASEINLWDMADGHRSHILITGPWGVRCLAFSPDGHTLASGDNGNAVKLWDVATGHDLQTLTHGDVVYAVAFSPDGHQLASAGGYGDIKLWDTSSGKQIRSWEGLQGVAHSVAFSPDGRTLASGGDDKTVRLWDVTSGHEVLHLAGHRYSVNCIVFSPDGRTLASSEAENPYGPDYQPGPVGIKIWDLASGLELRTMTGHLGSVFSLNFSADGRNLVSGSSDGTVRLWDVASGRELRSLVGHVNLLKSVAVSPDGRVLASGGGDNAIRLWNLNTGRELASLVAIRESDWVVFDPEGRFDGSNLDEIPVSWVFPDEPMSALAPEIFMRDYYQPKLLPRLLRGEKLGEIRSLASLNRSQPSVEIVKVEPEEDVQFVAVTVKVTSARAAVQKDASGNHLESGAYDLRLLRDTQLVARWPLATEGEGKTPKEASRAVELEGWRRDHHIKLANGECTHTFSHIRLPRRDGIEKVQFTGYAFNSDRVKSATTAPTEYLLPVAFAAPAAGRRRAYLISMGVNANQSRWNLDFAVPSAQAAAHLFREKLAGTYEVIDVSLFSTLAPDSPRVVLRDATKANLKAVLNVLAGRPVDKALRDAIDPQHRLRPATPDDAVALFISSHGYADPQGTFYVVPYDTGATAGITEDLLTRCHAQERGLPCEKANAFLEHTISSRDFAEWWADVDAGEMVIILDACHSAAAAGREFRPGPLGDAGLGQLSYDKEMRILTATQPDKTATATIAQELGRSLLVQAMEEEAKAHPQETLGDWLHETARRVPVLARCLYPERGDADLQVPELFDFAPSARHQGRGDSR